MSQTEEMSAEDLVRIGLLLDLNWRWAHPLGLEVYVDDEGHLHVEDCRRRSYGMSFGDDVPVGAERKIARVRVMRERRAEKRREKLGSVLEGICEEEPMRIMGLADHDETRISLSKIAGALGSDLASAIASMDETGDQLPVELVDWLVDAVSIRLVNATAHVLHCSTVDADGLVTVTAAPLPFDDDQVLAHGRRARLRRLMERIPELEDEYGELWKAERIELVELTASTMRLLDDQPPDEDEPVAELQASLDRLDELFALAQPGMRFFRPGKGFRKGIDQIKAWAKEHLRRIDRDKTEGDSLLTGDLAASEVKDPAAARERIEAEHIETKRRRATLMEQLEWISRDFEAQRAALDALDELEEQPEVEAS